MRFRGILQALLLLTKSAEPKRLVRQWTNRRQVCEVQSGDEVSDWQSARPTTRVLARKQPSFPEQDRRVRCLETRTPQTWCFRAAEKGDESAKPEEYFSWEKPGHSKGYRYFSAVFVQQDRADRHNGEDPGMGKTERAVCLFHKDDNDQSAYPRPSPPDRQKQ